MKTRLETVETTRGNLDVYFDHDVFALIDTPMSPDSKNWYYRQIAVALRENVLNEPNTQYVSKIRYINEAYRDSKINDKYGCYEVVVTDTLGNTAIVIIDIDQASIKGQKYFVDAKPKPSNVNPELSFVEPANVPEEIRFGVSNASAKSNELRKGFVRTLEERKKAEPKNFFHGISTKSFVPAQPPHTAESTFDESNYTIEGLATLAGEPVQSFVPLISKAQLAEESYKKTSAEINATFEKNKIPVEQRARVEKMFFADTVMELDKLAAELQKQSQAVNAIEQTAKREGQEAYLGYLKTQEELTNLKRSVIYAIYMAAGEYYEKDVQATTMNQPALRSAMIHSFNQHFSKVGIEIDTDGKLSDIDAAYKKLSDLPLASFQDAVNSILNQRKPYPFTTADKLKNIVTNINQRGDRTRTMDSPEPAFKAFESARLGFVPAKFEWDERILVMERKAKEGIDGVRKLFIDKDKEIKALSSNVTTNSNNVASLRTHYHQFESYAAHYKEYQEKLASVANPILDQIGKYPSKYEEATAEVARIGEFLNQYNTENPTNKIEYNADRIIRMSLPRFQMSFAEKAKELQDEITKLQSVVLKKDVRARKIQIEKLNARIESLAKKKQELLVEESKLQAVQSKAEELEQKANANIAANNQHSFYALVSRTAVELQTEYDRLLKYKTYEKNKNLQRLQLELSTAIDNVTNLASKYAPANAELVPDLANDNIRYQRLVKHVRNLAEETHVAVETEEAYKAFRDKVKIQDGLIIDIEGELTAAQTNSSNRSDPRLKALLKTYKDLKEDLEDLKLKADHVDRHTISEGPQLLKRANANMAKMNATLIAIKNFQSFATFSEEVQKVEREYPRIEKLQDQLAKYFPNSNELTALLDEHHQALAKMHEVIHAYRHNSDADIYSLIFAIDENRAKLNENLQKVKETFTKVARYLNRKELLDNFRDQLKISLAISDELIREAQSIASVDDQELVGKMQTKKEYLDQLSRMYAIKDEADLLESIPMDDVAAKKAFIDIKQTFAAIQEQKLSNTSEERKYNDDIARMPKSDDEYKAVKSSFIAFYNGLVASINMLQRKYERLEKMKKRSSENEFNFQVVGNELNQLKALCSKVEFEVFKEDFQPYRQTIKDLSTAKTHSRAEKKTNKEVLVSVQADYRSKLSPDSINYAINSEYVLARVANLQSIVNSADSNMRDHLKGKRRLGEKFVDNMRAFFNSRLDHWKGLDADTVFTTAGTLGILKKEVEKIASRIGTRLKPFSKQAQQVEPGFEIKKEPSILFDEEQLRRDLDQIESNLEFLDTQEELLPQESSDSNVEGLESQEDKFMESEITSTQDSGHTLFKPVNDIIITRPEDSKKASSLGLTKGKEDKTA